MDINILGSPASSAVQSGTGVTPAAQPLTESSVAIPTPVPVSATGTGASGESQTQSASGAVAPTLDQVKQAVSNINASLAASGNSDNVQFAVDPTSKRIVVKVIDPQTGKIIRQIPSEEIIQMGMSLGQKLGQVINQQA